MRWFDIFIAAIARIGFCSGELQCNEKLIVGKRTETTGASSSQECLYLCKTALEKCRWYMFDGFNTCSLFSNMTSIKDCRNCVSGMQECPLLIGSKVAFNIGYHVNGSTNALDIEDSRLKCSLPYFPPPTKPWVDMTVGHIAGGVPIFCGGRIVSSAGMIENVKDTCFFYSLEKGVFIPRKFANMTTPRYGAASMSMSSALLITGGADKHRNVHNTTEIISLDGSVYPGPEMPVPMVWHCLVSLNDTHAFMAGGSSSYEFQDKLNGQTFLINVEAAGSKVSFSPGPDKLNYPRLKHACAAMKYQGYDAVFISGGTMILPHSKLDLFVDIPEVCILSPAVCFPLQELKQPLSLMKPAMLSTMDRQRALLIGGQDNVGFNRVNVFEMACQDSNPSVPGHCSNHNWTKLDLELAHSNVGSTLLIPDFMTTCEITADNVEENVNNETLLFTNHCCNGNQTKLQIALIVNVFLSITVIAMIVVLFRRN